MLVQRMRMYSVIDLFPLVNPDRKEETVVVSYV